MKAAAVVALVAAAVVTACMVGLLELVALRHRRALRRVREGR